MNESLAPVIDRPTDGRIDLTRYRTAPLVDKLVELIAVPSVIRSVVMTSTIVGLVGGVGCHALFADLDMSSLVRAVALAYAVVVGLVMGACLAGLRVLAQSLANIESILDVSLDITDQAVTDYEGLQQGELELPTGRQLIEQVYDQVIEPAVESAVSRALGFLGWWMVGAYRLTVGAAIRCLVRRLSQESGTNAEKVIQDHTADGLSVIAENADRLHEYVRMARRVLSGYAQRFRFYAIIPFWIGYAVALIAALVPLVVLANVFT